MTFANTTNKKWLSHSCLSENFILLRELILLHFNILPPILVTFSESIPVLLNSLWLHPFCSILDWSPNFAQAWCIRSHVSRIAFITPKFLGFKVSTLFFDVLLKFLLLLLFCWNLDGCPYSSLSQKMINMNMSSIITTRKDECE